MIGEYCGKYLGYRHMSGVKAYCGDDVVTHIIYCDKCKKKNEMKNKRNNSEEICKCGHPERFHKGERCWGLTGNIQSGCFCKKFIPKNNHSSQEQNKRTSLSDENRSGEVESHNRQLIPKAKMSAPANTQKEICANCGYEKYRHNEKERIVYTGITPNIYDCSKECKKFIPKNNHSRVEKSGISRVAPEVVGSNPTPANSESEGKEISKESKASPSGKEPEDVPDEAPDKDSGSETLSEKIEAICDEEKGNTFMFWAEDVRDFIKKLKEELKYIYYTSDSKKNEEIQGMIKIRIDKLAGDLK